MAIVQLNPTTNSLSDTITAQNKVYKTQADITLTNFSGTGVPAVQSGSIFADNGTLFEVDANATINDSGVANGWVYVKYNVSNARFEYNVTTPTWSDTKQGYYVSNDRYFFKMYKVGAADFRYKMKYNKTYDLSHPFETMIFRQYTAATGNTIFDDLTYLLPNTGDVLIAKGVSDTASSEDPIGQMERFDADTILSKDGGGNNLDVFDDASTIAFTSTIIIEYIES